MADVYVEYMVKRTMTPAIRVRQALLALGGAALFLICLVLSPLAGALGFLVVLAGAATAFFAWRLLRAQQVEFEYALTNGELDVDRIIAMSSRKRVISFHCRDVESMARLAPGEKLPSGAVLACSSLGDDNVWRCTVKRPQKGNVTLVFNASEALLDSMKKFLPGAVAREAFRSRA